MKSLKAGGLSVTIGLGLLLTACSAAPVSTPAPVVTVIATTIRPVSTSPAATLPPPALSTDSPTATTAPAVMPESKTAPTRPTLSAAEALGCTSPAPLTPAQTEGPYYTPNAPQRTSLIEPGTGGTKVIVTGYVWTPDCQPVAQALLDFWQADDAGAYDNAGYRLRGHLFTDETGRYTLETIVPGEYPGRPPHIHVKVQAPNGPILTSQLYFPGVAANERDSIFDPALLADVQETDQGKVATFNFVINAP